MGCSRALTGAGRDALQSRPVPGIRSDKRAPRRTLLALVLVALTLAAVACGGGGDDDDAASSNGSAPNTGEDNTFTIWAPVSLQKPIETMIAKFNKRRDDIEIEAVYEEGAELNDRLLLGERPDLYVGSANDLGKLANEGTIPEEWAELGSDVMEIIVAPGNPKNIVDLSVFGLDPTTTSGLCVPEAPCGRGARTILNQAGITATPDTIEPRPPVLIEKVAGGQVDAGIVYRSQAVKAVSAGQISTVAIPTTVNIQVDYRFAIIRHGEAADAFLKFLRNTETTQRALQQAGLAPAEGETP
jgi:molybdate transport system substrate-binding protein